MVQNNPFWHSTPATYSLQFSLLPWPSRELRALLSRDMQLPTDLKQVLLLRQQRHGERQTLRGHTAMHLSLASDPDHLWTLSKVLNGSKPQSPHL